MAYQIISDEDWEPMRNLAFEIARKGDKMQAEHWLAQAGALRNGIKDERLKEEKLRT